MSTPTTRVAPILVVVGSLIALAPTDARAAGPVELDGNVGTDMPVAVSGGVTARFPFGLRASTSLGVLPEPYVDIINDTVQAFDPNYSDASATLVTTALQSSLVWRATVGYRPWLGLYVAAGYSLATLGGGLSAEDVVDAYLAERQRGTSSRDSSLELDLSATVHLAVVEVGWEQVVFDALVLRGALGYTGTFAASVAATPNDTGRGPRAEAVVDNLARETEQYLEDTFTGYVHAPVVSVSVGYVFF